MTVNIGQAYKARKRVGVVDKPSFVWRDFVDFLDPGDSFFVLESLKIALSLPEGLGAPAITFQLKKRALKVLTASGKVGYILDSTDVEKEEQ